MHQTLDQIRRARLVALRQRLGRAGMIRFLQQFDIGAGDYAVERHDWVDRVPLEELRSLAAQGGRTRRKSRTRRPRSAG